MYGLLVWHIFTYIFVFETCQNQKREEACGQEGSKLWSSSLSFDNLVLFSLVGFLRMYMNYRGEIQPDVHWECNFGPSFAWVCREQTVSPSNLIRSSSETDLTDAAAVLYGLLIWYLLWLVKYLVHMISCCSDAEMNLPAALHRRPPLLNDSHPESHVATSHARDCSPLCKPTAI